MLTVSFTFIAESFGQEAYRSPRELKKLSLEELVDTEITSASRRPERLSQASSAIDVITSEEILRAGVTNIPDALRLATGLQVAQVDGHTWAISARGFNTTTANKMQVVMDGRSLYTPLFSGVFWDVQNTLLPDLEQIEVIRGPGATLWGANAVNGVINIRTKSAKDTQGTLVFGGGGDVESGFGGVRYGGKIGQNTYFRVYLTQLRRDSMRLEGDGDADDETSLTQGGFRIDSELNERDTLTLQGDGYGGTFGQLNAPDITVDGNNVIARWSRQFDRDSNLSLQAYYDRTHRLIPDVFEEDRNTFDLELEHHFRIGDRHEVVYGANYRLSADEIGNLGPTLAFLPDEQTNHLVSGYVQDTIQLQPELLSITLGTKIEYNTFSGFEVQPTGRFAITPARNQTIWGAISRAVRTPTRIDQDLVSPNPSTGSRPFLVANPDFESEELVAYELGYRIKPASNLSFDLAAYYNDYDNLRSVEPINPATRAVTLENKLRGQSYGGALSIKWHPLDWWELDGSLTYLKTEFQRAADSLDASNGSAEGNDPEHMFLLRSAIDLPYNVRFDSIFRYVSDLPQPATPAYSELDLRLAWSPIEKLELAIVGRNLLDEAHPEFRQAVTHEVRRSVFGTIRWSF